MGLEVPDRVHIMPVGYEHDRVVDSATEFKADRVELIGHTENDQRGVEAIEEVEQSLDDEGIPHRRHECDFFDLYDSIGVIAELITQQKGNEVYFNIATGSKVTAVAGMIATTVTDNKAYYVKAETYNGAPKGTAESFELPHYPIEAPDDQQVKTLAILHQLQDADIGAPTKGEFIHVAEQNHLDFTKADVNRQGKYRRLDAEILDPMREQDYLEIEKSGRERKIHLTDKGKGAYRAFRALYDTESIDIETGTLDQRS